jgi:hypothetical protein
MSDISKSYKPKHLLAASLGLASLVITHPVLAQRITSPGLTTPTNPSSSINYPDISQTKASHYTNNPHSKDYKPRWNTSLPHRAGKTGCLPPATGRQCTWAGQRGQFAELYFA